MTNGKTGADQSPASQSLASAWLLKAVSFLPLNFDELKQMRKVYTKAKAAVLLERSKELVKWLKGKL